MFAFLSFTFSRARWHSWKLPSVVLESDENIVSKMLIVLNFQEKDVQAVCAPDVLVKIDLLLFCNMSADLKYDRGNILSLKCAVMAPRPSRLIYRENKNHNSGSTPALSNISWSLFMFREYGVWCDEINNQVFFSPNYIALHYITLCGCILVDKYSNNYSVCHRLWFHNLNTFYL